MDRTKEFLSTISHEIRTPLTSIKGFSKTILDSYDSLSDEQKKKFIKIILEQSERLTGLIENALTAAETDNKYSNFIFKKADINSILNKSIEVVKINYKNIFYKTDFEKGLYCCLDTDKTEQIFVNILDNASKYSQNSNTVEIKTGCKNEYNFISVKNYGTCIPKEKQDKIFDKFYRVDSYLTSKTQGSGLGLYIVKMLVEKMDGKIETVSENNPDYTEFIIYFPTFKVEEFTKGAKNI